jgi:hypothetical protein
MRAQGRKKAPSAQQQRSRTAKLREQCQKSRNAYGMNDFDTWLMNPDFEEDLLMFSADTTKNPPSSNVPGGDVVKGYWVNKYGLQCPYRTKPLPRYYDHYESSIHMIEPVGKDENFNEVVHMIDALPYHGAHHKAENAYKPENATILRWPDTAIRQIGGKLCKPRVNVGDEKKAKAEQASRTKVVDDFFESTLKYCELNLSPGSRLETRMIQRMENDLNHRVHEHAAPVLEAIDVYTTQTQEYIQRQAARRLESTVDKFLQQKKTTLHGGGDDMSEMSIPLVAVPPAAQYMRPQSAPMNASSSGSVLQHSNNLDNIQFAGIERLRPHTALGAGGSRSTVMSLPSHHSQLPQHHQQRLASSPNIVMVSGSYAPSPTLESAATYVPILNTNPEAMVNLLSVSPVSAREPRKSFRNAMKLDTAQASPSPTVDTSDDNDNAAVANLLSSSAPNSSRRLTRLSSILRQAIGSFNVDSMPPSKEQGDDDDEHVDIFDENTLTTPHFSGRVPSDPIASSNDRESAVDDDDDPLTEAVMSRMSDIATAANMVVSRVRVQDKSQGQSRSGTGESGSSSAKDGTGSGSNSAKNRKTLAFSDVVSSMKSDKNEMKSKFLATVKKVKAQKRHDQMETSSAAGNAEHQHNGMGSSKETDLRNTSFINMMPSHSTKVKITRAKKALNLDQDSFHYEKEFDQILETKRQKWQEFIDLVHKLDVELPNNSIQMGKQLLRGKIVSIHEGLLSNENEDDVAGADEVIRKPVVLKIARFSGNLALANKVFQLDPDDVDEDGNPNQTFIDTATTPDNPNREEDQNTSSIHSRYPPEVIIDEFRAEASSLAELGSHQNILFLEGVVLRPFCLVLEKMDGLLADCLENEDWQVYLSSTVYECN